jgi:hypothetical protein
MWKKRSSHRILVGTPEGKMPLGRPRHRWEGNITVDLKGRLVWTGLIRLRIGTGGGDTVMNFGFHKMLGKF